MVTRVTQPSVDDLLGKLESIHVNKEMKSAVQENINAIGEAAAGTKTGKFSAAQVERLLKVFDSQKDGAVRSRIADVLGAHGEKTALEALEVRSRKEKSAFVATRINMARQELGIRLASEENERRSAKSQGQAFERVLPNAVPKRARPIRPEAKVVRPNATTAKGQ
ncbi:Uncharacterised protein [Candidatus Burarchaeum australiense]|nr:Uncharacterised protein [Candidatus Burarchaeum australiense]